MATIADFSQRLQLEPQNGEIYALRGMCYEATGQFAKALADAERFLPFAPTAEAQRKMQERIARFRSKLPTK